MYPPAAAPVAYADLPVIHRVLKRRYTASELLYIDIAAVVLLAVVCQVMLPRDTPKVHGTSWLIVGWTGYALAALATCRAAGSPGPRCWWWTSSLWPPNACGPRDRPPSTR